MRSKGETNTVSISRSNRCFAVFSAWILPTVWRGVSISPIFKRILFASSEWIDLFVFSLKESIE